MDKIRRKTSYFIVKMHVFWIFFILFWDIFFSFISYMFTNQKWLCCDNMNFVCVFFFLFARQPPLPPATSCSATYRTKATAHVKFTTTSVLWSADNLDLTKIGLVKLQSYIRHKSFRLSHVCPTIEWMQQTV